MPTLGDDSASQTPTHKLNFSLLSIVSNVTLDATKYNDWTRNINMSLRFQGKEYVLEKQLIEIDEFTATPEEIISDKKHYNDAKMVACIMVATMVPELQWFYEDYCPYEMKLDIVEKFHKRAHK